jgi:hypothetical protein
MIIHSFCNSCMSRFDIIVRTDEGHLITKSMDEDGTSRCPRDCGGRINLRNDPSINNLASMMKAPLLLTSKEFYKALGGMGLPDEIPNSVELVESLLKSHKVADVLLEDVGGRIYLHELRLENGSTIHLASGGHGAQVLKVTRNEGRKSS